MSTAEAAERDWQMRYGRAKAQVAVYMQMVAALVRRGAITSDEGLAWVKKADSAAANVRYEDFVRIAPLKPTPNADEE